MLHERIPKLAQIVLPRTAYAAEIQFEIWMNSGELLSKIREPRFELFLLLVEEADIESHRPRSFLRQILMRLPDLPREILEQLMAVDDRQVFSLRLPNCAQFQKCGHDSVNHNGRDQFLRRFFCFLREMHAVK